MKRFRTTLVVLLLLPPILLVSSYPRCWAEQEESEDPHPLRLVAYFVHPVGYVLDRLIVKPFLKIVSQESLRKLFGHKGEPTPPEKPDVGTVEEPAEEPVTVPPSETDRSQGDLV